MPFQKPRQAVQSGHGKRLCEKSDRVALSTAAERARYDASPYHCRLEGGSPVRHRVKPATPCPHRWRTDDANSALRRAITLGFVSQAWEDGFPRYAWLREGDMVYEARHTRGPLGTYHAYPIDPVEAPVGLIL